MKGQTSLLQAQGLMNVVVLSMQIEKKIRIHQVQSCDVEPHPVVRHDPARGAVNASWQVPDSFRHGDDSPQG